MVLAKTGGDINDTLTGKLAVLLVRFAHATKNCELARSLLVWAARSLTFNVNGRQSHASSLPTKKTFSPFPFSETLKGSPARPWVAGRLSRAPSPVAQVRAKPLTISGNAGHHWGRGPRGSGFARRAKFSRSRP